MTTQLSDENVINYLDMTHKLNDYNEIHNLNKILDANNSTLYDSNVKLNENIKSRIISYKTEFIHLDNEKKKYIWKSSRILDLMMVLSLTLFALTFFVSQRFKLWVLIVIVTIIWILYLIRLVLSLTVLKTLDTTYYDRKNYNRN
jgi:Flp pilus assembly protein TadB